MTTVPISLELACCPDASDMGASLYETLSNGRYDWPASLLPLEFAAEPGTGYQFRPYLIEDYLAKHRTARKRSARADRLGYVARPIERANYGLDIHAINTSAPERQGRPMEESYKRRKLFVPLPRYPCPRHRVTVHGVLTARSQLVAYAVIHRAGQVAVISQILGHADHLGADVMYALGREIVRSELEQGGWLFYNLHSSGTDGLRYFKERLGFAPARVEWRR